MVKKLRRCVRPFSFDTGTSRRNGKTDGQTVDRTAISIWRVSVLTRNRNWRLQNVLIWCRGQEMLRDTCSHWHWRLGRRQQVSRSVGMSARRLLTNGRALSYNCTEDWVSYRVGDQGRAFHLHQRLIWCAIILVSGDTCHHAAYLLLIKTRLSPSLSA